MISSFTRKFKTFIFNEDPDSNNVNVSRKRKREDESIGGAWSLETDDDVIITAVKRPKTDHSPTPLNFFTSIIGNPYQKMSDWFKGKKWENSYFFKRQKEGKPKQNNGGIQYEQHRESGTNGNGHVTDGREYPRPRQHITTVNPPPSTVASSAPIQINKSISAPNRLTAAACSKDNSDVRKVSPGAPSIHDQNQRSLFASRPYRHFTATQCVRLDEREKYKMLLQRFTSVPVSTSPSSLHDADRISIDSRGSSRYQESILGDLVSSDILKKNEKHLRQKVVPTRVQKDSFSVNHQKLEKDTFRSTRVDQSYRSPSNQISPASSLNSSAKVSVETPTNCKFSKSKSIVKDRIVCQQDDDDIAEISIIPKVSENGQSTPALQKSAEFRSQAVLDFKQSPYMQDDWVENFTTKFSIDSRERHRKIAEEEIRAKVFDERRKANEQYFEQKVRERLKLFEKEPAIPLEIQIAAVEEEDEFPALTEEMEQIVTDALRSNVPDEVLVEGFKIRITRNDIATLDGLNWLNDEIINFYMNLLVERGEKQGAPKVYAFNTFFYPKILQGGHSSVRRWTRRVDIFAVDYIIIPVHLGMHWCLAIVDFKKKLIQYLDSMGGDNKLCLNTIKKYLCDESMDKKNKEFDLNGWKIEIAKGIPQQMNGSDCGMFACKYAEYITRETKITFSQQHMPYFRRRMVYEIIKKKLLQ